MQRVVKDLVAGLIVFLVALPLCLGIALGSNAPLLSGLVAGVVGGILVGILSGSHTSVTGPAAGLTAVVAAQIASLGSFEAFLLAVVIAGGMQIILGLLRAGALSAFFPSSVIQGLLSAIGVILILKQLPHLVGDDHDHFFMRFDTVPTMEELGNVLHGEIHRGALVIGLLSLVVLVLWEKSKPLKKSLVPAPLVVVILGVMLNKFFHFLGAPWAIDIDLFGESHLVQVPTAGSLSEFWTRLAFPDLSQLGNPAIYVAAMTIAIVGSLETLLNLDAVDKLDKKQRLSPPSRELWAQGIGNIASGLLGGLPMTSVIIRGSVNINAGAETKFSAIFHGFLLFGCVLFLPSLLNSIPLASLAAILVLTGYKLASPAVFKKMYQAGRYQFVPFLCTLAAIIATDLLKGVIIGLVLSLIFILNSNLRRPIRQMKEQSLFGEITRIELANQVSFLNRAALESSLRAVPSGGHLLLDARRTDYIDPDILSLIREFKEVTAPVLGIRVSLVGFQRRHGLVDSPLDFDQARQQMLVQTTPSQVVALLMEGNKRFVAQQRIDRNLLPHPGSQLLKHHAMVAFLAGIDSRTPTELLFDLGLGDAYTIRVPGMVVGPRALGGLEFACVRGHARLIVVLGHTHSPLIETAIECSRFSKSAGELLGCTHLESVLEEIGKSIPEPLRSCENGEVSAEQLEQVAWQHIKATVKRICLESAAIEQLVAAGKIGIVGAIYDIDRGVVRFDPNSAVGVDPEVFELNAAREADTPFGSAQGVKV